MIELDVQLCRDGEVVVIHDWTLDRTTTGAGLVGEHSLAELKALDAGGWFAPTFAGERVPTLTEVLAEVRLAVNVELKPVGDQGLEAAAVAVVERAGALGRVVFSSFEMDALDRLRTRSRTADLGRPLGNRIPRRGRPPNGARRCESLAPTQGCSHTICARRSGLPGHHGSRMDREPSS